MIKRVKDWMQKQAAIAERDAAIAPLQARLAAARTSHKSTRGIEAELQALTLSALKAGK